MLTHRRMAVLFGGDIVVLLVAFLLMVTIRFDVHRQLPYVYVQAKFFGALFGVWLIVFFAFNLYTLQRINPNPKNIGMLALAFLTNDLITIALLYFFPHPISPKTNLIIITALAFVLLVFWRRTYYHLFSKKFPTRIGIVGKGPLAHTLHTELLYNPHVGVVHHMGEVLPVDQRTPIDVLIVETASPETLVVVGRTLGAQTLLLSQAYEQLFGKVPVELMTDEKALVIITKYNGVQRLFYRVVEVIIAAMVLVVTSPLLVIAGIAIFIEDGLPIVITQDRVGEHGSIVHIHKFRSMKVLAPDGSAEVHGAQWATTHDPRVTRVGRVLRTTHIDEIPQLWNVMRGDLALIGPRAERPEIVAQLEKEIPYYYLRHAHKPGFTGWAQIKFRYARTVLDSKEKFEYDLYYLINQNPLLDLGIVLKTLQIIFTH
ncbi:MAG TPA: sugar transferase [Candidatus Paceibacterota bacterium]|nr:sugar transferase [Candidatus Paceibacterota bacterium]